MNGSGRRRVHHRQGNEDLALQSYNEGLRHRRKLQYRQNVVVSPGVKLGNNVKVQNNVSIYTGVICEDDVFPRSFNGIHKHNKPPQCSHQA